MKPYSRQFLVGALLASTLVFPFSTFAQDPAKADEKAAPPASTATPNPDAANPTSAPPADDAAKSSELRRIDGAAAAAVETPPPAEPDARYERSSRRRGSGERVAIGHDVRLEKDERADSVVAIFGSATSFGEVGDAVVSVIGDTRVTGPVGDTAFALLGSTYVNSKVGGDVLAIMGNVELGPDAVVRGDVVSVGGAVTRDPKAVVQGDVRNIGIGPVFSGRSLEWLLAWFRECGVYGRMLWFAPHLGWAWALAVSALFLYVILALLFRGGVEKGVKTFETRPGSSILAAILTALLAPVMIVLLCITVVGIALVPFLAFALLIAVIYGKAIILAWLGRRITRLFGDDRFDHPALAVLIGGLIVMALYTIPVVGIIAFKVFKILGLGVVVYMVVNNSKRERAVAVPVAAPASGTPLTGAVPATGSSMGFASATPGVADAPAMPAVVPPLASTVPISALPHAGFWIRIGALLLDGILVGVIVAFITNMMYRRGGPDGPQGLLLGLAIYGAVMWKLKGTTIGGIICGLKVVRTDGRVLDWPTAIVRALSCFLSLIVVGLGFFWVIIDDEKQSWHDKIAGTAVVRVPRGMALV